MPKKKQKRVTKIKRGTLVSCYACPPEHPGWMRSQLKNRKRLPYCILHLLEYDKKNRDWWPSCPQCGGDEFGTMEWNGSIDGTIAFCDDCDFMTKATNYFSRLAIKITASPIDRGA